MLKYIIHIWKINKIMLFIVITVKILIFKVMNFIIIFNIVKEVALSLLIYKI